MWVSSEIIIVMDRKMPAHNSGITSVNIPSSVDEMGNFLVGKYSLQAICVHWDIPLSLTNPYLFEGIFNVKLFVPFGT